MARAQLRTVQPTAEPATPAWRLAQAAGLVAYLWLIVGLLAAPVPTLHVFWDLAIPLVPLLLFINPLLWRNVCPLATLNTVANGAVSRRRLQGRDLRRSWYAGIALLFLFITARLVWFNQHGAAAAALLAGLATAAVALGAVFDRRGGFCNSVCPLLPVERLYGQHPLYVSEGVRCPSCSACVTRGCVDLSPALAGLRAADAAREGPGTQWLRSAPGLFAIAFPGVIGGYFLADTVAASSWLALGLVAGGGLVSACVAGLMITVLRAQPLTALPALALTAGLGYYWFASATLAAWIPGVSTELGTAMLRTVFIAILAGWYARGWSAAHQSDLRGTESRSPTSPPGESFLPLGG